MREHRSRQRTRRPCSGLAHRPVYFQPSRTACASLSVPCMMTVELRYYTDPACVWSWGAEPQLRRLLWEFGDAVRVRLVLGGLARSYGPLLPRRGGSDRRRGRLLRRPDRPLAHRRRRDRDAVRSAALDRGEADLDLPGLHGGDRGPRAGPRSRPRLRSPGPRGPLLRAQEARPHRCPARRGGPRRGSTRSAFASTSGSNAIVEAFGADLDEVRAVPDEARAAGAVRRTEGRERVRFPSLAFERADGARHGAWGWRPYEDWREVAIAAGAEPRNEGRPEPLEVIERFGRCATQELVELSGRPRTVVEAELWGLARDWRLKPVPVLTGTLWELA